MDREIPENIRQRRRWRITGGIFLAVLLLIFTVGGFRSLIKPTIDRSHIVTAITERGSIDDALTASGTVVPEFEQAIGSPIQSKIDSVFYKPGDDIKAGASILKLNDEFILMNYSRLKDEHEMMINRKQQYAIDMQRELIDLQAELDIKEMRAQYAESKYLMEKQLMELGAGTREALQLAELNHAIALRELDQLRLQIANKKERQKADLREQDLQIRISGENLKELERQMELAEVRAERDGVVTWVNENLGANVNPGEVVARIADLSSFKVEGTISDIHADKLKIGRSVNVRTGDRDLRGRIAGIRPTIEKGIVTFLVELDDKRNASLRSNLRVDVYVILASKENVIRVKNGPFVNGSGKQDIFIVEGDKAVRRTVDIGATNFDFVELQNQVEIGEEVIISDMEKHQHHQVISIKND